MYKKVILLIVLLLSFNSNAFADTREYITDGTYNMGDGETPAVAEQRALILAKQNAIGQAGTYLENYCEVNNFQLKKDEIRTISSGIIKTTILDHGKTIQDKGGIQFWVKIKATVTTDGIPDMIKRMQELSTADRYSEIENNFNNLQTEHIQNWGQTDKAAVNEKEWLANYWLDLGVNQFLIKDYKQSSISLTKSYNLIHSETARILLGDLNFILRNYDNSISWYSTGDDTETSLYKKGLVFDSLNRYDDSLECYKKIVYKINDNNALAWLRFGIADDNIERERDLLELKIGAKIDKNKNGYETSPQFRYYTKAITLNPKLALAYYRLGLTHENMVKHYEAAQDYKKYLELADSSDENYKDAKNRLQALKDKYGIM